MSSCFISLLCFANHCSVTRPLVTVVASVTKQLSRETKRAKNVLLTHCSGGGNVKTKVLADLVPGEGLLLNE